MGRRGRRGHRRRDRGVQTFRVRFRGARRHAKTAVRRPVNSRRAASVRGPFERRRAGRARPALLKR